MRLAEQSVLFSLGGIPMVGNTSTGGVIGLTEEGARLCQAMREREVRDGEIPPACELLVTHLREGGYLAGCLAGSPEAKSMPEPARRVRSAYLHVTQRCNLSCRFCYSEDEGRNALPDPSTKDLCTAIDLLASFGCERLIVSGGEPFLRSDLPQIASHARGAGIEEVVILSNGLLLGEKDLGPLTETVDCIGIAFDGALPDSVAHLRGKQGYERLVNAVRLVRAAGIEARVLPTIHAKNLQDMPLYQELAQSLDASVGFSLLTAPSCELEDFALSAEQLRELGVASVRRGLPDSDSAGKAVPTIGARLSCGAGVSTLSVAADGTVYPCHMLHDPSLAMGNAFTDSSEKVMGGEVANTCRDLDVRNFEECGDCEARYLCGGGCRARTFMDTRDLRGHDPYCELSRSYYSCLGQQLARQFGMGGGEQHAV